MQRNRELEICSGGLPASLAAGARLVCGWQLPAAGQRNGAWRGGAGKRYHYDGANCACAPSAFNLCCLRCPKRFETLSLYYYFPPSSQCWRCGVHCRASGQIADNLRFVQPDAGNMRASPDRSALVNRNVRVSLTPSLRLRVEYSPTSCVMVTARRAVGCRRCLVLTEMRVAWLPSGGWRQQRHSRSRVAGSGGRHRLRRAMFDRKAECSVGEVRSEWEEL